MSNDENGEPKAVLAVGALGLGAAGSVVAVSGDGRTRGVLQQQPSQVLVFAYDYNPGLPFRVVNRIQQETVNSILGQREDNGVQPVSDPTDYNGYVVQYQPQNGSLGEYTLIFVREATLSTDSTYQFNPGDVAYFNSQVNLLQAGLRTDGAEETTPEDETTTPEDETTTPEDETTTPEDGDETTTTPEETTPAETTPAETTTPADAETTTPEETTEEVVVTTDDGG